MEVGKKAGMTILKYATFKFLSGPWNQLSSTENFVLNCQNFLILCRMSISKTGKYKCIIREEDLLQPREIHYNVKRVSEITRYVQSQNFLVNISKTKKLGRILYILHRLLTQPFVIILPTRQTKLRSNVGWCYGSYCGTVYQLLMLCSMG